MTVCWNIRGHYLLPVAEGQEERVKTACDTVGQRGISRWTESRICSRWEIWVSGARNAIDILYYVFSGRMTTLFHLHFNTPDVEGAAERLAQEGVSLRRRFGSTRGEGVSLGPGEEIPEEFRFKLQVHQRGYVNITLAPGQRQRFDHLGLIVEDFESVLERAESLGWSVRRTERRTFIMTPWGFRVEVHPVDGDAAAELGDFEEAHIEEATLRLSDVDAVRQGFDDVFGDIPQLLIERGEGPRIDSFQIGTEGTTKEIDMRDLLGS